MAGLPAVAEAMAGLPAEALAKAGWLVTMRVASETTDLII